MLIRTSKKVRAGKERQRDSDRETKGKSKDRHLRERSRAERFSETESPIKLARETDRQTYR